MNRPADRSPIDAIHPELRGMARVLPRGATERSLMAVRRIGDAADRAQTWIGRRRGSISTTSSGTASTGTAAIEVAPVGAAGVRLHRPPAWRDGPHPALLWIHGGGYVIGTASQEDDFCARVAAELGAVVAAVDYRRAPEHPFPAPLDDCHDALVWLAARDDVDPDRVAIGGASAGGGLAAGLALLARDRGEVAPVFQALSYPMLDDRTALRRDVDQSGFRLWNNQANRYGWRSYLGAEPGDASVSGLAAPARHEDLAGVAPAWIGIGTLDLFYDEDLEYARRLAEVDVACQLDVYDGAFHAFDYMAPRTGIGSAFRTAQLRAIAEALGVN